MESVTQCAHDTDGTIYCNKPYEFTYTNIFGVAPSDASFMDVTTSISNALYSDTDTVSTQLTQIADFNGDGLSDVCYLNFDLTVCLWESVCVFVNVAECVCVMKENKKKRKKKKN